MPNRYTLALLGIGLIGQTAMVALDVTTFGRVAALPPSLCPSPEPLAMQATPFALIPGIAALLYLSYATEAWQTCVLMLGVVWVLEVVYLQVRFQYGRALVRTVAAGEVRAGDVPRHRRELEAADGTLVCEAGEPLSRMQVTRLRRLKNHGLPEKSSIEREQGFPFLPFIVAGALLTAVFAGNLAPPLIDLGIWLRGG